jgi:hypothetical protein
MWTNFAQIARFHCPQYSVTIATAEVVCRSCAVEQHHRHPLHRVKVRNDHLLCLVKLITLGQEWNSSFFEHLYLRDLGLRIQLNHPPGSICQWRTASHKDFVVLHMNSIHSVNIDFCGCSPAVSNKQQLLHTSWWPAMPLELQMCARFALLNQLHLLSLQGKTSAFDFYRSLEYITENHGLWKLPVSNIPTTFRSDTCRISTCRIVYLPSH